MLSYNKEFIKRTTPTQKFAALVEDAEERYGAKLKTKKDWGLFWRVLTRIRKVLFFNPKEDFLTDVITTIGPFIFFPVDFEPAKADEIDCLIYAHELEHVSQYSRCGLGCAWLGMPIFLVLYCLLPFPLGISWFRYHFERKAFLAEDCYARMFRFNVSLDIKGISEQLSGKMYFFAWPFRSKIEKWFQENIPNPAPKEPEDSSVSASIPRPAVSPSQLYVLKRNMPKGLEKLSPLLPQPPYQDRPTVPTKGPKSQP